MVENDDVGGGEPYRILVVDDFEGFRRFVDSALRRRTGFQVVEASDGLAAVEKTKELKPDLILLDIGLPSLNGLEVARRIREFDPSARILFLSQESSGEVIQEALGLGATGYVHKSSAQRDLLPAIEAVLKGKQFVSNGLKFRERTNPPHRHEIIFCCDDEMLPNGLVDLAIDSTRDHARRLLLASLIVILHFCCIESPGHESPALTCLEQGQPLHCDS